MTTETKDDQKAGTRAPNSKAPEAPRGPNSQAHTAQYGNDAIAEPEKQKDGAGMPAGYKPDTSVTYHAAKRDKDGNVKDGEVDMIKGPDGEKAASAYTAPGNAMETLPEKHTYRDRVEAQAKTLGIEVDPAWTLEYLLWMIQMKGSS